MDVGAVKAPTIRRRNRNFKNPGSRRGGLLYDAHAREPNGNLDQQERPMSNHFTGLSLGPPLGDQRLDLCDLYAFQSPGDKN